MATEIESLLDYVMNIGGTELIVTEGAPSAVRLAGKVCSIPDAPAVESGALREFLGSIEGESGAIIGGPWANSRWRVRYFRSALGNSAVFRPLMDECPNFADLGAPQTLNNLLGLSSGLVVFAGPACAGKTTTATSYVSALCESRMLRACLLDSAGEYPVRTGDCLVLANTNGSASDKMAQALRCGCDLFWISRGLHHYGRQYGRCHRGFAFGRSPRRPCPGTYHAGVGFQGGCRAAPAAGSFRRRWGHSCLGNLVQYAERGDVYP